VIDALAAEPASAVRCRANGWERAYLDEAASVLETTGTFVARIRSRDERLAALARRDPAAAASEAAGRAGPVARAATETGFDEHAAYAGIDELPLRPYEGLTIANTRIDPQPPGEGELLDVRTLSTGATVRRYSMPDSSLQRYHLVPQELSLDGEDLAVLGAAREQLASGAVRGARAARRAVRAVADGRANSDRLGALLARHTGDLGVFADLFADERLSDVFANAPVEETHLTVRVDGALAETNVRLTASGAEALASQFRRRSGRAFSKAAPTLDAAVTVGDRRVRVAATTEPATDGMAFALRGHDDTTWRLSQLVANGTLPPAAAAFLAESVVRSRALLLAGTRGAGKTTMLGALLWELPPDVRTLVIEDTPELPVAALQGAGRDVQALRAAPDGDPGISPASALRTGLRLGEGALVVGEVRGSEAAVLYEAMRVGAHGSAVLGTIHGDGGESVRERVVADLDVPESSFGATDLIVTLEPAPAETERSRQVAAIEEVLTGEEGVRFAPLFERTDGRLSPTGRIARATSPVAEAMAPEAGYDALLAALARRERRFREYVRTDAAPVWDRGEPAPS
jgi:type IV secretory pathway ATPase VirB11/archaellum biosynthesis ATPase